MAPGGRVPGGAGARYPTGACRSTIAFAARGPSTAAVTIPPASPAPSPTGVGPGRRGCRRAGRAVQSGMTLFPHRRTCEGIRVVGPAEFVEGVSAAIALLARSPRFAGEVAPHLRAVVRRGWVDAVLHDAYDPGRRVRWLDDDSAAAPTVALASFLAAEAFRARARRRGGRRARFSHWARRRRHAAVEEIPALEYQMAVLAELGGDPEAVESLKWTLAMLRTGTIRRTIHKWLRHVT